MLGTPRSVLASSASPPTLGTLHPFLVLPLKFKHLDCMWFSKQPHQVTTAHAQYNSTEGPSQAHELPPAFVLPSFPFISPSSPTSSLPTSND